MRKTKLKKLSKRILTGLLAAGMAVSAYSTPVKAAITCEHDVRNLTDIYDINYEESLEEVANPYRGFYKSEQINYKRGTGNEVRNPKNNFVHLRLDLSDFSANPVKGYDSDCYITDETTDMLKALRGTLDNCRKNHATVVVRFAYDYKYGGYTEDTTDSKGKFHKRSVWEPQSIDTVLQHQDAVGAVLRDYEDIIASVECGVFGKWGEMHGSQILTDENLKEVMDKWLEVIPENISVTVRTPELYCRYTGADLQELDSEDYKTKPGDKTYRVGIFNDGYLGSKSDRGTYKNRETEISWIEDQSTHTLYGGEIVLFEGKGTPLNNAEYMEKEAFRTHTSYLNIGWNDHVIDDLRESTFQGKDPKYSGKTSSFTYVQNHLGYRYVVDGVKLTKETTNYENFAAEVSIKNVGFANIVKDMKTTVIIEGEGGKYEYPVSKLSKDKKESAENADPRNWLAGKTSVLKVNLDLPEKMKEGSYKVYLRVAYDENKKGIEGYPVKFANDDSSIWNETLGANYLGKFKVVSESTIEKEGAKVENKTSSKSPSYKIDKSSSFYTFSDKKDGCHISYTKSKTENWKNIAVNFSDVDTSKYKKVVIKVVPSRKGMNLGITNQDENKPVFYKDHWDKNNQFTSTKEQTITINLDSKNKNGIYIYCDATKNDTPSGKQTFVIKSITFKK